MHLQLNGFEVVKGWTFFFVCLSWGGPGAQACFGAGMSEAHGEGAPTCCVEDTRFSAELHEQPQLGKG